MKCDPLNDNVDSGALDLYCSRIVAENYPEIETHESRRAKISEVEVIAKRPALLDAWLGDTRDRRISVYWPADRLV